MTWESDTGDGSGKGVMAQVFDMVGYGKKKAQDLTGTPANEVFRTGAKNDSVDGGAGRDKIVAGTGNDNAKGGAGNDRLQGQAGNDRLDGGEGNDVLVGGTGKDRFVFNDGRDTIKDFRDNQDTVLFDHDLVTGSLNAKRLARIVDERADSLVFDFGGGDRLTIEGISDFADLRNDLGFV